MPMQLLNDSDINQISAITFQELNDAFQLIGPEERGGELLSIYTSCIENIKTRFEYPRYYNGLIALLLLFSTDESYELIDRSRINHIFHETEELAIYGYENIEEDVGIKNINQLISSLRTMSDIFLEQNPQYQSAVISSMSQANICLESDYFACENGVKTQIKPVDYSVSVDKRRAMDTHHFFLFTEVYTPGEENYLSSLVENFNKAYLSATSGYILTTIIGNLQRYTYSLKL